MLRKLLKYDFKANLFYFLLMYGVLMGIAVLARVSIAMADSRYLGFVNEYTLTLMTVAGSAVLYLLACGAVMILTLLLVAMRFYKNLMGPEGYLSFTLPVSEGAHLASKMLSGVIFLLLSSFMIFVSASVATAGLEIWDGFTLSFFRSVIHALRMDHPLVVILYLLESFATVLEVVAVIYVSVCVGQLAAKHRVLGAIGIFLAIYLVLGMVTTLGSVIFIRLLEGREGTVLYYSVTSIAAILFRGLVAAGSLAGSLLLMKRKLNLE